MYKVEGDFVLFSYAFVEEIKLNVTSFSYKKRRVGRLPRQEKNIYKRTKEDTNTWKCFLRSIADQIKENDKHGLFSSGWWHTTRIA